MAKRKKTKAETDGAKAESSPGNAYVARVHAQFDRGSYGGVGKLAAAAPADLDASAKQELDELVGMTKIDPVQLAIGIGGVVLVLIVGLLTLS